jgi:serine/threonine protein kinase
VSPRRGSVDFRDLPSPGCAFLEGLVSTRLLIPSAVARFLEQNADRLARYTSAEFLADELIRAGLLTQYQADRVMAGTTQGLVLGNYRILDRLGAGGMGVVFLAEQVFMKRQVAVKVLPLHEDCSTEQVNRFYSEMRVLADLHHPNIVAAFEAGKSPAPAPGLPDLLYLVMELVTGGDLEHLGRDRGPAAIGQACDWVRQAACGLQAAHDNHLVHRDIKPSNLLLSERGQIKVVDFGLVRQFNSRLTEPRSLLGTVEYMAPEQSIDACSVGSQADIYGLGATLFWLLTGEPPYPRVKGVAEALRTLQETRPRRLRAVCPHAPKELDTLIDQMLDRDPTRRPTSALAVMKALEPFCKGAADAGMGGQRTEPVQRLSSKGSTSATVASTINPGFQRPSKSCRGK